MSVDAKGRGNVTLKDVAARVGVTQAAVSMALAGNPRISEKTRRAVQRAAAELGYVPSSAGRALRRQSAGAIALIVPNTSHHVFGHAYFMHVLTGVSSSSNAHDAQVIVSTNTDGAEGVNAYERVIRSGSADGVIVTSAAVDDANVEALVASGLPVVLIGNFPYLPEAVSVGTDDVAASRLVTEHLITVHGRSRLLHVSGPLDHQTGIDRREGFLQAVRAHALGENALVLEGDMSEESGAEAVRQAHDMGVEVDGVVFANDDMAFGGMQTLRRLGRRVGDDIALVGFDDFGIARTTTPGITTMRVPAERMALAASDTLFAILAGERTGPAHVELPVEFIARTSCGCAGDALSE
ncbi:LacI family DNA-binding transcriptional regulator [Gryllotalpicola reticulitermitis]|uniref:LacI family DNA-binding transcriptional regulator n=1 Tax=Gryllotalpicola reticulitermitis TaxID=1184153 RepID=A0ABV8Q536_9MICO